MLKSTTMKTMALRESLKKKMQVQELTDSDAVSSKSKNTVNNSDRKRLLTSRKWNVDKVKPVKKKDCVMSLFHQGMGVESTNEYKPPKLISPRRDVSKSN